MNVERLIGTVTRVGYPPDPWWWTDWRFAQDDGRFGGRWDDSEGNFRVIYAGESLYACLLEVLSTYRADTVVVDALEEINEDPIDAEEYPTARPGVLARSWAPARRVGTAEVLAARMVDPSLAANVIELRPHFIAQALRLGLHDYDTAALKNASPPGRQLTRAVSTSSAHTHRRRRHLVRLETGGQPPPFRVLRATRRLANEPGVAVARARASANR